MTELDSTAESIYQNWQRRNAGPLDANFARLALSNKRFLCARVSTALLGLNVLVLKYKLDASSFHTLIVLTGAISQAK